MIEVRCDIATCKKELNDKSALIFSPPAETLNKVFGLDKEIDVTRKFHICKHCYENIIKNLFIK